MAGIPTSVEFEEGTSFNYIDRLLGGDDDDFDDD